MEGASKTLVLSDFIPEELEEIRRKGAQTSRSL
jgi:hypothetical protein